MIGKHRPGHPDVFPAGFAGMASGGGFVFATIHNILAKVPPENIIAMIDTIREFRGLDS
jgi:uroporphyrinogen-III decarboxylase